MILDHSVSAEINLRPFIVGNFLLPVCQTINGQYVNAMWLSSYLRYNLVFDMTPYTYVTQFVLPMHWETGPFELASENEATQCSFHRLDMTNINSIPIDR